ncbi:MAG: T9SS type A sorting domain-containing protein, partial [Bacteroidales bacterium]|nr:T9SS type A sorting domain-containing protein [Bacteroidales bacterium]
AGNIYTFKLGCEDGVGANGDETVGAGFDTFLELYNAAGDWFQSDDDGCESYRSKLVWTATGTIYYVKVRGYNSSNYGPYTAAYKYTLPPHCVTPGVGIAQDEILPDPTEAWQTGGTDAIVSGGCYVYKVAVDEDNIYTFKTGCTDGSAAFDSFLELYDADGDWITENDDGCAVPASGDYSSKIEWTASYTGNAYVKVRGYHSSDYGNFTLAYKHIICGPDVVALATGEPAKNQIKVYPNPANQSFTVVSKAPVTFTRLIVSEFTGRLVKSWDLEQPATFLQIESTGFAPGVYILSIETSEGWIRKKVSIIR